jgi:hypothetical protein
VHELPAPFVIEGNLGNLGALHLGIINWLLSEIRALQHDEEFNAALGRLDMEETGTRGLYRTLPVSTTFPVSDCLITVSIPVKQLVGWGPDVWIQLLAKRAVIEGGPDGFRRMVHSAIFFDSDHAAVDLLFVCPCTYQSTTTTFTGADLSTSGPRFVRLDRR